jgi:hypothetical protein
MYALGYPVGHTAVLGAFSKIQKSGPQAALLGWFATAGSLARIIFPIVSGYIDQKVDNGPFSLVMVLLTLSLMGITLIRKQIALYTEESPSATKQHQSAASDGSNPAEPSVEHGSSSSSTPAMIIAAGEYVAAAGGRIPVVGEKKDVIANWRGTQEPENPAAAGSDIVHTGTHREATVSTTSAMTASTDRERRMERIYRPTSTSILSPLHTNFDVLSKKDASPRSGNSAQSCDEDDKLLRRSNSDSPLLPASASLQPLHNTSFLSNGFMKLEEGLGSGLGSTTTVVTTDGDDGKLVSTEAHMERRTTPRFPMELEDSTHCTNTYTHMLKVTGHRIYIVFLILLLAFSILSFFFAGNPGSTSSDYASSESEFGDLD